MAVQVVNKVDIQEAKNLITSVIQATLNGELSKHINICIHGSPGVGKSSIVKQAADEFGIDLIDLRLSAMESGDVLGIPFVFNGEMEFSTPKWWPDGSRPSILFLDELKTASPSVQVAAFRLILDRSIQNGKTLPSNCIIMAAGNLKEDKSGARDLLPAAANRFDMHLIIDKNRLSESFLNHAVMQGYDRSVIGYLTWKKSSIYGKIGDEEAFASPRTWEGVSNIRRLGITDKNMLSVAIAGAVGSAESISFMSYLEYNHMLPDWERIREGDNNYKYTIASGDQCLEYSVAVGAAIELLDCVQKKDAEGIKNLCERIVKPLSTEMKVICIRTTKRNLSAGASLLANSSFAAVWNEVKAYLA